MVKHIRVKVMQWLNVMRLPAYTSNRNKIRTNWILHYCVNDNANAV